MQKETHGKVEITENGLIIPALIVIVGQSCSLKCRHCSNFSPYAPDGTKRYSLAQILGDLQLIFQSSYHVKKIQVQGGEPFLYTELAELLNFLRNSGKVTAITVATNGTIIPSETILCALKQNHVRVRISKYPVTPKETLIRLKESLNKLWN